MVSLQDRLTELLRTDMESTEQPSIMPKLQRVQPCFRERNAKYYSPKLVSIGPIHHHKDYGKNLQQGEKYKFRWAAKYLEGIHTITAQQLLQKIVDDMPTLKGLYTEDAIEGHSDEELAWIFFIDGCAVLYFMEKASIERPKELKIKIDQLMTVLQDLLLLENQLPFRVLKLLSNDNVPKLVGSIKNIFKMHNMIPRNVYVGVEEKKNITGTDSTDNESNDEVKITIYQPKATLLNNLLIKTDQVTHLLDLLRKILITTNGDVYDDGELYSQKSKSYRNVQELKASGIRVRRQKNARLTDITFKSRFHFFGTLYLSKLIVDDSTAPTLLNLIAYEMCPDFENHYEICSYVTFLDSLIDQADDVKELRKARVLHNALGSDEEVATLFNTIGTDLVPDPATYEQVRRAIEDHYRSEYKALIFQAYHNYFHNPWAFLGFAAACIALFLATIQTWFTVFPRSKG